MNAVRSLQGVAPGSKRWKSFRYPELPPIEPPVIESVSLDSGPRVFLLTDREFPIVELTIRLPWGNRDESEDRTGLTDILQEALRSGGSRRYPGDALNTALDSIGASLEIESDDDFTSVYLFVLKEYLKEALAIVLDLLENPLFPPEQIEAACTQLLGEIMRRNDEPEQIAEREFKKIIIGDKHPYARVPELFTVGEITRDELVAFYEAHRNPSQTLIGAAGDVTLEELVPLLSQGIKSSPVVPKRSPVPPPPTLSGNAVHFVQKDEINQSYIVIGHIGVERNIPDYVAYSLWHRMLSGPSLSGRLFSVIRSQMGLAYAVYSKPGAEYGFPGIFSTYAVTRSEATLSCIRAILSQIDLLREGNFTDEEFSLARDATLNSFVFYYASPAQIIERRLDYETYGYPPDFLEKILARIPAVTREEATASAVRHIRPENFQFLVVGNRENIKPFIDEIAPVITRDITIRESAP